MKKRSNIGWMELISGIVLLVLGILSFIHPGKLVSGIVILYGVAAIITGIADIVFFAKLDCRLGLAPSVALVTGVISVMVGVMLLVYPNAGKLIMSLLLPIWFMTHCISRLVQLNVIHLMAEPFLYYATIVVNVIGLILSVVLLFNPAMSLAASAYIIGAYLVLLGIDGIILGVSRIGSGE